MRRDVANDAPHVAGDPEHRSLPSRRSSASWSADRCDRHDASSSAGGAATAAACFVMTASRSPSIAARVDPNRSGSVTASAAQLVAHCQMGDLVPHRPPRRGRRRVPRSALQPSDDGVERRLFGGEVIDSAPKTDRVTRRGSPVAASRGTRPFPRGRRGPRRWRRSRRSLAAAGSPGSRWRITAAVAWSPRRRRRPGGERGRERRRARRHLVIRDHRRHDPPIARFGGRQGTVGEHELGGTTPADEARNEPRARPVGAEADAGVGHHEPGRLPATTRSQAHARLMPAPAALPCTAATTGASSRASPDIAPCRNPVTSRRWAARPSPSPLNSARSPPTQKRAPRARDEYGPHGPVGRASQHGAVQIPGRDPG